MRLAVEDYKGALALDPDHLAHNVHLHLGLCKVLVKLGRGKDASSSCSEALNIDGELLEALVQVCCRFTWSKLVLQSVERDAIAHSLTVFACFRGVRLNF